MCYETSLSAIKKKTSTQTRIPCANGDRQRAEGTVAEASKRPNAPDGLKQPDRGLPRTARLRSSRLFQEAYNQSRRATGRYMVLFLRSGPDASLRLGVVAGRRVGNAVSRARAKRLLREAYRLNRHRLHGVFDIVLVARRTILQGRWKEIEADLLQVAARAGLTRIMNRQTE